MLSIITDFINIARFAVVRQLGSTARVRLSVVSVHYNLHSAVARQSISLLLLQADDASLSTQHVAQIQQ